MAMYILDGETHPKKGNRAVLKWTPWGRHHGQRHRRLKSSWHNTGNAQRDFYFAHMEIQKRVADQEKLWDAQPTPPTPRPKNRNRRVG